MSLKSFHRFFIVICLALFAFLGFWASGRNPTLLVTPWLVYASIVGGLATFSYLAWHVKTVRLPA